MIRGFQRFIFIVICAVATSAASDANSAVEQHRNSSIFLRLYIGTSLDEYIDYSLKDANVIVSKLNNSKKTVFYFHGFIESVEKESVQTVTKAYLKRNDHNIIVLDYRKVANKFYPIAAVETIYYVAPAVVKFLNKLVALGFNSENLHCVGFSLGAQLAGYVGSSVNFTIPRITGLEPAGPLFYFFLHHLSSSDARMVDIIHTDYGIYGIARSTGTVDFFPNYGYRVQPGCPYLTFPFTKADFCSHLRSWRFYAESLLHESAFVGVQCPFSLFFRFGICNNNARIIMGYDTPSNANGTVYLKTNDQSPFGRETQGTMP